ncbi:MAG: hypothetical protein HFH74_12810 [Lachnospiraceae bacterium]|jgi:virulence-associated protein VapD|nr:hypothetical protein [Lachnospiraceae bacterium]
MKKFIGKLTVCIVVFVITLFVSSSIYNQGNKELTTSMTQASLPLVHITTKGIAYNYLHGLKQEMDGSFFRDTITPLETDRALTFVIDKYKNTIQEISFEVRSIDGTRLVEQTRVSNFKESEDRIQATVTIKDLIEPHVEYNWILMLKVGNETLRYYTRIIDGGYNTYEKLTFVKDFHDKTFDKEQAKDLITYLESNAKGDNTTLSRVDIHCNLKQITWADLNISQITEPQIIISEIEEQTASIRMNYRVQTVESRKKYQYNVVEFYRIRYTPDRTYLLDYERSMNQLFDPGADVYGGSKIMLGIRDANVQMMESDGGSNLAFVNQNQLFCYHAADKKIAYLFSFYDGNDPRSNYDNHDIKILNVDETENVRFMVYGYMNRGKHEGSIGVQVCEYNGMLNTVEELIFIPYNKAYATLKTDMEQLSFINKNGVFYIYLDGSILAINLLNLTCEEIAGNLQQGSFEVSSTNKMLVWQNSADAYNCTKLILMNLNTGERQEIRTSGENRMLPLGFIGEDLIYGVVQYEDISIDFSGSVTFPMNTIYIQDEQGKVLKTYQREGIYVTDASIENNLITLTRVAKNEDGNYSSTSSDQIVNNLVDESGYNSSEVVVTQTYQKIVQLVLKNAIETKKLKNTNPLQVLFEGSRELAVTVENPISRYYVYGRYGIDGTFTHESEAINLAYNISGTVVNQNGDYIWKRTTRSIRNQIMAITGKQKTEGNTDLAVCLETILEFCGSIKNVQPMLDNGKTVKQILEENLNDVTALDLTGVSLDAILYYVNQDIPVLVSLENDRAMLVIGFNELNVVVMNPETGTVYKIGMNDATNLFRQNGNAFVTYFRKK